jgi:DNA-3-methyladenine glycosylase
MHRVNSVSMLPAMPRDFYDRPAAQVAPDLLGKVLLRRTPDGLAGGIIVETEAYLHDDPACHAVNGPTPRNRSMFGPPGHAYVYFIYGCHYCANAVCGPEGVGEAVLIRALEPKEGIALMRHRRPGVLDRALANGPAKLCVALDIARSLDGADLCSPRSGIWIAAAQAAKPETIATGPRIGITKATGLHLRFFWRNSAFVSR